MAEAAVILLVTKNRKAHGVHETTTDTQRPVLCTKKSARQSEYYEGHNAGFRPEYQFDLTLKADYHGESSLIFNEQEYDVIRTYDDRYMILEVNNGVMMENLASYNEECYKLAKKIYTKAIEKSLKN